VIDAASLCGNSSVGGKIGVGPRRLSGRTDCGPSITDQP
jgi:hypothetical protein